MAEWTKEPWWPEFGHYWKEDLSGPDPEAHRILIMGGKGQYVAEVLYPVRGQRDHPETIANAERILSCVHTCQGVTFVNDDPTGDVARLVRAARDCLEHYRAKLTAHLAYAELAQALAAFELEDSDDSL